MSDPIQRLGLSCPMGGTFYICQNSAIRFVGCCAQDPCADGSGNCKQEDLRYSSFGAEHYDDIPPESCASSAGLWYTCKLATPPFMGCCTSNPCNKGCSQSDLVAPRLADVSSLASVFLTPTTVAPTKSSPTANPTKTGSSTGTAAGTGTSKPTKTSPPGTGAEATGGSTPGSQGGGGLSTGAIAGIAIGVVVVFAILVFLAYKCGWARRGGKDAGKEEERHAMAAMSQAPVSDRWSPYKDSFNHSPHTGYDPSTYSPEPSQREFRAPDPRHHSGVPPSIGSSWVSGDSRHLSQGHLSQDSRHLSQMSGETQVNQQWAAADYPQHHYLSPVAELGNTAVPRYPSELPASAVEAGPVYSEAYRTPGRQPYEFGGHPERI